MNDQDFKDFTVELPNEL